MPHLLEEAKKVLPFIERGEMPGGCISKDQCEAYCKDESHIDECVDLAVKAGLISRDEAAYAKKYKITGGPGG